MAKRKGYLHRCDACGWEGYTKWEWSRLDVRCGECKASVHGNQIDGIGGELWLKKWWWVWVLILILSMLENFGIYSIIN